MQLQSTITCPHCGHQTTETMPTDACQFFYECKGCGALLKPLAGDCCVFCSYGDVPCPPIQEARQHGRACRMLLRRIRSLSAQKTEKSPTKPENPRVPRWGRSRVGHTFAVVGERHGAATFWNFDCVDSENAQLNPSSGKRPEPGRRQFLTTRRNVIASRTNALAIPINSGRRKIVNSDE